MCYRLFRFSRYLCQLTGPQVTSMLRALRFFLFLWFAAFSCPGMAAGQQGSPSPSRSATSPEPTPIPLAKVPLEAETTLAALQDIRGSASKEQSAGDLIAA